ncbi:helix-turn-helix domain-containing protein [Reyranella sp. CPCC 100927]|uniref:AlbA family DNA-binding domain-containing protein n=1 Tax=Reyranella sp. CPCC 100927 TaxID=2599616 RepID=UPI0011B58AAA|nr:ATP-binding protein [Reyranella sp. CPCC 100927]TWS94993.1 ATP-binding protein [Reyranella sp. CPCC 100927]
MIDVPLSKIDLATIDALISNGVTESQTLDFKADLSLTTPDDKKEFLKDVSAFANAAGGDLVLGVTQDKATGAANGRPGIAIPKFDSWMQTLENLLHSSIDPRLPAVAFHPIPLGGDLFVVVLRIRQSWYGPHRVELGRSKFYGRHSAGVFEMNVTQLRNAFTLSDTLTKRVQDFRDERLARIVSNAGAIGLKEGAKLVVHACPIASFAGQIQLSQSTLQSDGALMTPLGSSGTNFSNVLEGFMTYSGREDDPTSRAYTLSLRNGVVEFVTTFTPTQTEKGTIQRYLWLGDVEAGMISAFDKFMKYYKFVGITPPLYAFVSIVDALGYDVRRDSYGRPQPLRRHDLMLPEVEVTDESFDCYRELKPTCDILWNAFGYSGSPNFRSGAWRRPT